MCTLGLPGNPNPCTALDRPLETTMTVYRTVWNPEINNKFNVSIDQYNERDRYAMKIKIGDETHETVGHVPIELNELSKLVARCRN